tara:strand:+ start:52 stop:546 length:495 start_codon:yes stop_codon:yes gene_type:complete
MIVSCPNCNKKFNLDEKLIPQNGRLLQCSSCNHKWHYSILKIEDKKVENDEFTKNIKNLSDNTKKKISTKPALTEKKIRNLKTNKNINKNKSEDTINKNLYKKITLANIFNNLIIIMITFIAIILILDTFRSNISNYLPILNPLLDNLYLSIFDLFSFLKDLFN